MQTKILVVEDDKFLRDGLFEMLKKEDYLVFAGENCAKGEEIFYAESPDLILLDVMLPDGDGFSLCKKIREVNNDVPIIFLTACDDEYQVVRGLDSGADDYVTKPFKMLELLSRIRAVLRRSKKTVFATDDLIIDTANMTVTKINSGV